MKQSVCYILFMIRVCELIITYLLLCELIFSSIAQRGLCKIESTKRNTYSGDRWMCTCIIGN